MDDVYFGLKRAYQATLKEARVFAAVGDVTPARFDLLYAVGLFGSMEHGLRQQALQIVLGVGKSTVSRMVKSLQNLRFLRREREDGDRRRRIVFLTRRGRGAVRDVLRRVIERGRARQQVTWLLSQGGDCPAETLRAMSVFEAALRRIRTLLGDTGSVAYFPACRIESRFILWRSDTRAGRRAQRRLRELCEAAETWISAEEAESDVSLDASAGGQRGPALYIPPAYVPPAP